MELNLEHYFLLLHRLISKCCRVSFHDNLRHCERLGSTLIVFFLDKSLAFLALGDAINLRLHCKQSKQSRLGGLLDKVNAIRRLAELTVANLCVENACKSPSRCPNEYHGYCNFGLFSCFFLFGCMLWD